MINKTLHKQKGLTVISWLVVIIFLLFQGILAMKVIPVYITDSSVKSLVKNLETDMSVRGHSIKKLKKLIEKNLRINNVYDVKSDNILIKKRKGGLVVTVAYEPRGKLVGNLEYIVAFSHEATIPSN